MNLSDSVAVCCYELSRGGFVLPEAPKAPLATADDRERLAEQVLQLFDAAGYLNLETPANKAKKVRQSLIQWNLRSSDLRLFHGILRQMIKKIKGAADNSPPA